MRVTLTFLCSALILAIGGNSASGQAFGRLTDLQSNAAVYGFAKPGDATKRVYLWGAVQRPGLYEVVVDIDLPGLLSLAGGPVFPIRSDELVQRATLRLYRPEGSTRRASFEAPIDSFLLRTLPMPNDGDVVEVTVSQRRIRTWRDNLGVLGAGSAIAVALVQVITLFR